MIGRYLKNDDLVVSYDVGMEDGPDSEGLEFTTGGNFKLAVSFMSSASMQPFDPSAYHGDVGVSVVVQNYSRNNGVVTPSISKIDL